MTNGNMSRQHECQTLRIVGADMLVGTLALPISVPTPTPWARRRQNARVHTA